RSLVSPLLFIASSQGDLAPLSCGSPSARTHAGVASAAARLRQHVGLLLSGGDPRLPRYARRRGLRLSYDAGAAGQVIGIHLPSLPPLLGGGVGDAYRFGILPQQPTDRLSQNHPKHNKEHAQSSPLSTAALPYHWGRPATRLGAGGFAP